MQATDYRILEKFDLSLVRGEAKACSICNAKYGAFKREHICKRCFRSICDDCVGNSHSYIYSQDRKNGSHKCCSMCAVEIQVMTKYIQLYKLELFKDSAFADQWCRKILRENKNNNYNNANNDVGSKKTGSRRKEDENEAVQQLWEGLNYSLRHMYGLILRQSKDTEEEQNIKLARVLKVILTQVNARLSSIIYLTLLVGFHCSESATINIVTELINRKNKDPPNKSRILEFVSAELGSNDTDTLGEYLDYSLKTLSDNLGANSFTAEVSISVLNSVLTKVSIEEYERAVASILINKRQFILANRNNPRLVETEILRNLDFTKFETVSKRLSSVLIVSRTISEDGGSRENNKSSVTNSKNDFSPVRTFSQNSLILDGDTKSEQLSRSYNNVPNSLSPNYAYENASMLRKSRQASNEGQISLIIPQNRGPSNFTTSPNRMPDESGITVNTKQAKDDQMMNELLSLRNEVSQLRARERFLMEQTEGLRRQLSEALRNEASLKSELGMKQQVAGNNANSASSAQRFGMQDLITRKNQQISNLRFELNALKDQLEKLTSSNSQNNESGKSAEQARINMQQIQKKHEEEVSCLKSELRRIEIERNNTRAMNELLMKKLNELAKTVLDKEQHLLQEKNQQFLKHLQEVDQGRTAALLGRESCHIF